MLAACADQPLCASQPNGATGQAAAAAVTPATAGPLDRFLRAGSREQDVPKKSAATPAPRPASATAQPVEVVVLDEDEGAPAPMDVDATPAAAAPRPSNDDEVHSSYAKYKA